MDRQPDRRGPAVAGDAAGPVCRWLRWKGLFLDAVPDPTVPSTDDGFVWCVHSMNCLGPGGQVASKEECRAGRSCFEL